jgi:hypothetical protein
MDGTRDLIDSLVAEARPVRRLHHPLVRSLMWCVLAAGIVCLLGLEHGIRPDFAEQMRKFSFKLGLCSSLLTGALAAIGCLMASLPDRSRSWLLLPTPALLVWISTISYGCLTDWVEFDAWTMRMGEAARCFATLVLVSLPLSGVMFAMLRHTARLRPRLITLTAGLAVAAIASSAMALLHELDATIMILIWNLGAAFVIVAIEGALGSRIVNWFDHATSIGRTATNQR